MNNKEQQPEPLAAILAEMRASSLATVRAWADRIEAEANKMRAMLDANIARVRKLEAMLDGAANTLLGCAIKQKESAPGNAAAMREALESVDGNIAEDEPGRFWLQDPEEILHEVQTALAAPARNCDRPECATAEGAIAALRANPCADHDFCKEQLDCAECATRWLLAQSKKGGEK